MRTVAEHAGDPRAQVESLFDVLVTNACKVDSRGCALANAAVEITEPDHPARPIIEKYKAEMRRRFRQLAHEMGAREPDALGDALMLLWEGSLSDPTHPGPAWPGARCGQSGARLDRGVHRLRIGSIRPQHAPIVRGAPELNSVITHGNQTPHVLVSVHGLRGRLRLRPVGVGTTATSCDDD